MVVGRLYGHQFYRNNGYQSLCVYACFTRLASFEKPTSFENAHRPTKNRSLDNYCTAIYFMWVFGLQSGLSMSTDILGKQFLSSPFSFQDLTAVSTVMIIPIALGMQMNLSRRLHFAIFFILVIGAVSIVANIVRFTGILPIAGPQLGIGGSVDAVRTVMFWSHIEFACAFIAACLPSYRALWLKKKEEKSASGSRDYSNSKSTRSKASDEEDTIALAVRPSSGSLTPERSPSDTY